MKNKSLSETLIDAAQDLGFQNTHLIKNPEQHTVEIILNTLLQVEQAIADNNQNVKDCTKLLKELKKLIKPKKPNIIKTVLQKILNKTYGLSTR